jgi:Type VI secretion system VasI, EvfG, VC_A0118
MRIPLIVIMLSIAGGAACAQSPNEGTKDLEGCFQLARDADLICSNPANSAVARLDCLEKARKAQLECLERVPSASSARAPLPEMPTVVAPKAPPKAVAPELSTGTVSPDPAIESPEAPAGSVSPKIPARTADTPPKQPDTNWIVSETTSPVDYSPLITAVMRVPSNAKDAPTTLAVRCRGQRTELLVRTEGTWRPSRPGEVQVSYQINDQPLVKLGWTASADGKAASYKDDAVDLLRSLPQDARLKITVLGSSSYDHEATFQLAGFDAVREKIATACKWAPIASKMSSGKR